MALQKINWTQIDSPFVPSGHTVDIGSFDTPVNDVYVQTLLIANDQAPYELHNFFWYLNSGYTPGVGQFAQLTGTNIFHGQQIIQNTTGDSIVARRNIVVSGTTTNVILHRNGYISVSGATGNSELYSSYLVLNGPDENTGIALISTDPLDGNRLYFVLSAADSDINPVDAPAISQMSPDFNVHTIIAFQSFTGWTDGRVTFYVPVAFASGITVNGNIDITGQYLINGVPFGGFNVGVVDHGGLESFTGSTGVTLSTIYNSALDPALAMVSTVGGIPASTTVSQLTGKTLVQLFDDLLFPTAQPTYTIPTITMTGVATQTLEAGSIYSPNISLYGDENDASSFTQLRILRNGAELAQYIILTQSSISDIPPQFGYPDPNNPNLRYTIFPSQYNESYVIPSGSSSTTTYNGDGNYNAGVAKYNNKGILDGRSPAVRSTNAPQASSTFYNTSTYTITGIFPYFYGTSDTLPTVYTIASAISGGTATKVLSSASGTLTIPYNVAFKYLWFAYQSAYTSKTIWYVNALNNGNIDGSFITTAVTHNINSPNNYWTGINFKMHWSVYATEVNTIEFRNS